MDNSLPISSEEKKQAGALREAAETELRNILAWWMERMPDQESGGFYGRIDAGGQLHPRADKGVILNTRILWAFSAAARTSGLAEYAGMAERACRYILEHFLDRVHGGVFWMLDYRGAPVQPRKQVYAQAFAIYALAEYYALSGKQEALETAMELFLLIEKYSRDPEWGGYYEAFEKDWQPAADLRLSEKEPQAAKTMNTHLHILEAYTRLFEVDGNQAVGSALHELANLLQGRFIDAERYSLHLFFSRKWERMSHEVSFGHDIEYSWLATEAAEVLQDEALSSDVSRTAVHIAGAVLQQGVDADGALLNEAGPQGLTDTDKHWWPQAEAMVGFINAWQLSGEKRFLDATANCWSFIQTRIKDPKLGEWRWGVTRAGTPLPLQDIAGPWKAPYHNGRMCLEVMKRLAEY